MRLDVLGTLRLVSWQTSDVLSSLEDGRFHERLVEAFGSHTSALARWTRRVHPGGLTWLWSIEPGETSQTSQAAAITAHWLRA